MNPLILDAMGVAGVIACGVATWADIQEWRRNRPKPPPPPPPPPKPKACNSPFPGDATWRCERLEGHEGRCRHGYSEWFICRRCKITTQKCTVYKETGYLCPDCVIIEGLPK